jgi:hypothetical protein
MFHKYASLAVAAAKDLAKYQSPTFKAIEVSAPAPAIEDGGRRKVTRFTLSIFGEDLRTKALERQPPRVNCDRGQSDDPVRAAGQDRKRRWE